LYFFFAEFFRVAERVEQVVLDLEGNPDVAAEIAEALPEVKVWIDQGVRGEADIARLPLSKPGGWKTLFKPQPSPKYSWHRLNVPRLYLLYV
jgi:hypothetical protein